MRIKMIKEDNKGNDDEIDKKRGKKSRKVLGRKGSRFNNL